MPQVLKIASDQSGASVISYTTWWLWTAGHVSTRLYAAVNINDRYFAAVSVIYAACCLTVIGLTFVKRRPQMTDRTRRLFDPSEIDRVVRARWL